MKTTGPLPRAGALGFTLLAASLVASIWTNDWKWALLGVAALITAAVWSATEHGGHRD